ncbi:MAG TPA: hypothetical protein VMV49_04615 [Candidatus Deferrimicrobium sp.]|nr:hypothetical protein [Candidatus Deferrimicrobium sp.]
MDEIKRRLVVRFCQAEGLKSNVINMMQILLKLHDYLGSKKEEPDIQTLLSWFLNLLNNEITQAASISQSKTLIEAQNLIAEVIEKYSITGQQPNFQQLIDILRETVTKITTEAAKIAKELEF